MPPSTEPTSESAASRPDRPGPGRARRRTRRAAWLAIAVPLLFFTGLLGVSVLQARHAALDHALMVALQRKDTILVNSLLAQGADPNTTEPLKAPPPTGVFAHFLQTLRSLFRRDTAVGGDWQTALVAAVKSGSAENVRALLDHGAKAYRQDSTGTTPIWYAADVGNMAVARLLLEHEADIDAHCKEGTTALTETILEGHLDMTRLLLDHGADINAKDAKGNTALMHAVGANLLLMHASFGTAPSLARLLLNRGADATLTNNDHQTPFFVAVSQGETNVVRLLLDRGLAKMPRGGDTQPALLLAASAQPPDDAIGTLRVLLDHGADVNEKEKEDGETALAAAALTGNDQVVRFLLQQSTRIDERDSKGDTALIAAAFNGHDTTVALLLQHGAKIDAHDRAGHTALEMAIENGYTNIAAMLRKAGARVGDTPDARLLGAAKTGDLSAAKRLLARGANVNARDTYGQPALMSAAYSNHSDLVQFLLDHGADANATNSIGESVLWGCIYAGADPAILRSAAYLLDHGANVNARGWKKAAMLEEAAGYDNPSLMHLMLDHGADIDAVDEDGETPLMRAVGRDDMDEISRENIPILLTHHPNLNTRDNKGVTALLFTIRSYQVDKERLLLVAGANPNVADNDGMTPLMEAARSGNIALLCPLLEKGAALDLRDKLGRTALALALAGRHLDAVERLRQAGAR